VIRTLALVAAALFVRQARRGIAMTRAAMLMVAGVAALSASIVVPVTTQGAAQAPRPAPAGQPQANTSAPVANGATYVGSEACRRCHAPTYERWSKTRMANVVVDPKQHPEAVIGDFARPNPARTFTIDDVAFTYGSKWKQRYFKKVGNDYFPLPAQWDVANRVWRPYFVPPNADWWVPHYPADNMQRPMAATR
jgi:hypothetical protein